MATKSATAPWSSWPAPCATACVNTTCAAAGGGEEFLVLLPATPPETAQGVMDRLVGAVRGLAIDVGADVLRLTVSIGMAYHQLGETFSETLSRADQALYLAKQDGRDRVALGFPRP